MKIPDNWTFKSLEIATQFDDHVREQLPWYEFATNAVALLARHFIPKNGLIYDIGASTGNIARALAPILDARDARIVPIEESTEMAERYSGPGAEQMIVQNALDVPYTTHDVSILFLTLMFLPPARRYTFVGELYDRVRPGGAMIIVDKVEPPRGYLGTALGRLTLAGKVASRVPKDEIVDKELSLAGIQRPISPCRLPTERVEFFRYGDFVGYVIPKD